MATCGYLCPSCEGRGFVEGGAVCTWCSGGAPSVDCNTEELSVEDWLRQVHEGPCCSDREEENNG